jgi:hypothetical protein
MQFNDTRITQKAKAVRIRWPGLIRTSPALFTKNALGAGDYREGRDPLAPHALAFVGAAEQLAARLLDSGVAGGKHYREIYADARARLKKLGAALGEARFPIFEEV